MRAWLESLPTMVLIRYARLLGCRFTGSPLPQRSVAINFLYQMSMSGDRPLTVVEMQVLLYRHGADVPTVFEDVQ